MAGFGTNPVLRNGDYSARVDGSHLLCQEENFKMTRRDRELLEKQLWGVSSRSPQNGIIILMTIAVFLVGMGIGDILSKTKQASTHYAALISYPGQK
jgi:hypothetical protein